MKSFIIYLCLVVLVFSTGSSINEPRVCNPDESETHYNLNIDGSDRCIL